MSDEFNEDVVKDLIETNENREDESLANSEEVVDDHSDDGKPDADSGQEPDDKVEDKEPSELEKRAAQYGLDPEHFKDEDALQAAVTAFDMQVFQAGQQQQQQFQQQPQPNQQQQPQQPEPPQWIPSDQIKFEFPEDVEIPEELANSLNGGLQTVAKQFEQQMQVMAQAVLDSQQWIQQQQQQVQQQQYQQYINEFDGAIESLNRPSSFGKGGYESLDGNSVEAFRRSQIADQVDVLHAGYQARGVEPPSMKELVKIADQILNAEELARLDKRATSERARRQASKRTGGVKQPQSRGNVPDDPVLNSEIREFYEANSID